MRELHDYHFNLMDEIVRPAIDEVIKMRDDQIISRLKERGIEDPLNMDKSRLRVLKNGHDHALVLDGKYTVCTWNDRTEFIQDGTTLTIRYNL